MRRILTALFILLSLIPSVLAAMEDPDDPCKEFRGELAAARRQAREDDPVSAQTVAQKQDELLVCTCKDTWLGDFTPKLPFAFTAFPLNDGSELKMPTVNYIRVAVALGIEMDRVLLPELHACSLPSTSRLKFAVQIDQSGSVAAVTSMPRPDGSSDASAVVACMSRVLSSRDYLSAPWPYGYEWTFLPLDPTCASADWQSLQSSPALHSP